MSGFIQGEDRFQATLFPERLDDYIKKGPDTFTLWFTGSINRINVSGPFSAPFPGPFSGSELQKHGIDISIPKSDVSTSLFFSA